MSSLIPVGDGPPDARCKLCGKTAVGPCARCKGSVCGDCCELTEGGATTFAICLTCVKRGGSTLTPAWLGLLGWLALILLPLAAAAVALRLLLRH
jgi:hypothetical protein